jgi:GT2 family glycosyltransferase
VIAPCLNALSQTALAQGSIVVLSGLSEEMERDLTGGIRHILPHAHVVVSDTGLSAARNAALEAADQSDVVAYVDDDAVVGPTWAHGMQRAWTGASPDLGAVGGPIRPRFLAPRPGWMSDFALAGLSILDLGEQVRRLDGRTCAAYGANLSVRVEHARALGGFDTSRGPAGSGPGFGDDIEMQLRMVDAGLEVLYEPTALVEHLIGAERLTRRALLRRRFQTGVDYGRNPTRPRRAAAAHLPWATAKGLAFAALGRSERGMDSLAYAAQCLGELKTRARRG